MCVNCNDSLQVNLPIGPAGANGINGVNAYFYTASADNSSGLNFHSPAIATQNYVGFVNTSTPLGNPITLSMFTSNPGFTGWHNWQGPQGIQGIQGIQGPIGPFGGVTFEYKFIGAVASPADPGAGKISYTVSSFSIVNFTISNLEAYGGNISQYFQYLSLISSSSKAAIRVAKKTDATAYQVFRITSGSVLGSSYNFVVNTTPLATGLTPLQLNDDVLISFSAVGDKGNSGNYVTTTAITPNPLNSHCPLGGLIVQVKDGITNAVISTDYICTEDTTPSGMIQYFAGSFISVPFGYLVCDGSAVSRTTYANLFAVIGTTYGAGDGVTTFNVPDLQGLFVRGAGTSSYDTASPRAVGSIQLDSLQNHRHTVSGIDGTFYTADGGSGNDVANAGASGSGVVNTSTPKTGGASPDNARVDTETRPANMAFVACIKY